MQMDPGPWANKDNMKKPLYCLLKTMKNLVKDLTDFVVSVSPDPSSIDLPPVGYQLDLKSKTVTKTQKTS